MASLWTLQDFIYQVRRRLDAVDDTDYFTDDEITSYLNESLLDLESLMTDLETTITYTALNAQVVLFSDVFPNGVSSIRNLYLNGSRLDQITSEESLNGKDGYYVFGSAFHFTTAISGTLQIFCQIPTTPLSSTTDKTFLPSEFQHLPVLYALARCRQKDGEYGQYLSDMNDYDHQKDALKQWNNKRTNSTGIYHIIVSDYGDDSSGY